MKVHTQPVNHAQPSRALVTGSSGFIGSKLTTTLVNQGWSVKAGRRAKSKLHRLGQIDCELVPLDLQRSSDQEIDAALADVSHVFHVAGLVCGTLAQLHQVNTLGTDRLFTQAAKLPKPPTIILVSSAAAAGPADQQQPRSPSSAPQPISHYGRSKLAGERAAIRYATQIPLTIVRPGVVFGAGDTEFIRIIRAMYRMRVNAMIGKGTQPLSLIDVEDLVTILIRAAAAPERVEQANSDGDSRDGIGVYHAADPKPMSLIELGKTIRPLLGKRVFDLHLPIAAGYCVGATAEFFARLVGRSSTLSRDKITEASAPGWFLDVSKTIDQFAWQPSKSIEEHLALTVQRGIESGEL